MPKLKKYHVNVVAQFEKIFEVWAENEDEALDEAENLAMEQNDIADFDNIALEAEDAWTDDDDDDDEDNEEDEDIYINDEEDE